jgi:hypothetical protein
MGYDRYPAAARSYLAGGKREINNGVLENPSSVMPGLIRKKNQTGSYPGSESGTAAPDGEEIREKNTAILPEI